MKILIAVQYKENYGTEENPYWKFKGGDSFLVAIPSEMISTDDIESLLNRVLDDPSHKIVWENPYSVQYLVDWSVVSDDYKIEIPDYLDEDDAEEYRHHYTPRELVLA